MIQQPILTRRHALLAVGGIILSPGLAAKAAGPTRGVSDSEIVIGTTIDLSGVTAVQGTNAANAIRMAFDAVNARGGIHGRKIRWILEDNEYIVPKAVQAANKLLNRDNIFFLIGSGGTPHMDAIMPTLIEKGVPNLFPLTCARSMYEPLNRYKFGQFASYYDQMRAAVKYFVENHGKRNIGAMYQDTDYGKDVLAGAVAQTEAMGLKIAELTAHRPTDTDFNAPVTRLKDAGCDLIIMGTIVKDTTIILQTARKMGWNPTFCGNFATYSTAVAEAPGEPAEGFYSMSPALYHYPDDPTPAIRAFNEAYRKTFGIRPQLPRPGGLHRRHLRDRRVGEGRTRPHSRQFHQRDGEHEGLARHLRRSPALAQPGQSPRLQPVVPVGGEQDPLGTCGGGPAELLKAMAATLG